MNDPKSKSADSSDNATTSTKTSSNSLPRSEREGIVYSQRILSYLKKNKATFFCGEEDGTSKLLLNNDLISLNFSPDNTPLAQLLHKTCQVSTFSIGAKAAIQRVMVYAATQSGTMRLRRFSARSDVDGSLYIPIKDRTKLLTISATGTKIIPNGSNPDSFWLEHPTKQPFEYTESKQKDGLAKFEELCVRTQATKLPSMQWLVGMAEGLFPFVREYAKARFITAHIGPSQAGKTSGAQRFVTLHGLGEVKGDCSIASLRNLGDCGLLCLDNKENRNFTHELVDHLLFVATGSESMRADREGNLLRISSRRPVGVITSIEGVYTDELQRRIVLVEYQAPEGPKLSRKLEDEIAKDRHGILSSMIPVLQVFLQGNRSPKVSCPVPGFGEHFEVLCDLLEAFGEVASKPSNWAQDVIAQWLGQTHTEEGDSELEGPLSELIRTYENDWEMLKFEYLKQKGVLYITEIGTLHSLLLKHRPRDYSIPKTLQALTRRLYSNRFFAFQVVTGAMYPEIKELQRTKTRRPIGLFLSSSDEIVN